MGPEGENAFSLDNRKAKVMEFPSETKPALWGAAGGAILLAIVGFTWGGWMTTSSANKLADQRADTAVVAILTPICVDKFQFYREGRLGDTPRSYFPRLRAG